MVVYFALFFINNLLFTSKLTINYSLCFDMGFTGLYYSVENIILNIVKDI